MIYLKTEALHDIIGMLLYKNVYTSFEFLCNKMAYSLMFVYVWKHAVIYAPTHTELGMRECFP